MTAARSNRDDEPQDQLRSVFESIGGHARSVNLERAERLHRALAAVAAGCREEAGRRAATEVAHQVVGSAGTFGFRGASQLAAGIERYFVEGDFDDPVRLEQARDQVRRLVEELSAEPDYQLDEDDPTS